MEDSQKRILIKRYFERPPKDIDWSWKWILFCVFVGPLLCCVRGAEAVGGCIIAAGILYVAYQLWSHSEAQTKYRNTARATDEEFDEWLEEDLKRLNENIIEDLNIEQIVREPISIQLPSYPQRGVYWNFKNCSDKLRYTPIDLTLLNFTDHQLIVYRTTYDTTTGKALNPSTDEYFYEDIVSVSTSKDSTPTLNEENGTIEHINYRETFKLVTAGGTSLSLNIHDPELIKQFGNNSNLETRVDQAVRAIRSTLRDKKSR